VTLSTAHSLNLGVLLVTSRPSVTLISTTPAVDELCTGPGGENTTAKRAKSTRSVHTKIHSLSD